MFGVILNFVVAVGIVPFYRVVGGIGILQLLFPWIRFVKDDQGGFHFSRHHPIKSIGTVFSEGLIVYHVRILNALTRASSIDL